MNIQEIVNKVLPSLTEHQKRDLNWLLKESSGSPIRLKKQIHELLSGKPLAYILGYVPFYDCKIFVDKNCLIPRQETELLVDMIVKSCNGQIDTNTKFLDLCSGSGAIAIAIQKKLKYEADAVEIKKRCCKLIVKNSNFNECKVNVINCDMFEKVNDKYDFIVSNPPYIETTEIEKLDSSVKDFEPHIALDGGKDGLDFYRKIAENSPTYLKENGQLFLEIGFEQAEKVSKLLEKNFTEIEIKKDYSNLDRFIFAKKR